MRVAKRGVNNGDDEGFFFFLLWLVGVSGCGYGGGGEEVKFIFYI